VEGTRLLLDCPVDLSALAAFAPVPLAGDAEGLVRAVPRYWSPAAGAASEAGGVDAVLVSSATGLLGLPFLTRLPGFANAKVHNPPLLLALLFSVPQLVRCLFSLQLSCLVS
jgi:integrator complex subunit 9